MERRQLLMIPRTGGDHDAQLERVNHTFSGKNTQNLERVPFRSGR